MDLISAINYSGLMAEYAISAEKDNLGNVISSTYGKKTNDVYYIRPTNQYSAYSTTASYQINDIITYSEIVYSASAAVTPGSWSTNSAKFNKLSTVVFSADIDDITELYEGMKIALAFTTRGGASNTKLNINELGEHYLYKNINSNITTGSFTSGQVLYFTYFNDNWRSDHDANSTYAGMVDAYVSLGATATNISAACTNFSARPGNTINVTFPRDYTAVSAKKFRAGTSSYQPLYLNGSATSDTNYFIPSGTWPVYYDGDNWYLWTDGSIQFSAIRGTVIGGDSSTLSAGTDLKIEDGIISVNTDGIVENSAYMCFVAGSATYASGIGAAAFGYAASAVDDYAFAEGCRTEASNSGSHAEGLYTHAIGLGSHSEGAGTSAAAQYTHVEGVASRAIVEGSHAEGNATLASGYYTHTEGSNTLAQGYYTHAEGSNTLAQGNYTHAEGHYTSSTNYATHAEGSYTLATGQAAHTEGSWTEAIGMCSHAEGQSTTASGHESHAEGAHTLAEANYTHAEGHYTSAIGYTAHAEGDKTFALGNASHAEGQDTSANYGMSHAEGVSTLASGYASHTEGSGTRTNDSFAHAEGYGTSATSAAAHAEGWQTSAAGIGSCAGGIKTMANASATHAEGYWTRAVGSYSHAEGWSTTASGTNSHAEGYFTLTVDVNSHAEGQFTSALGHASHAEGGLALAKGDYTHVEGVYTSAQGYASHAEGSGTVAKGDHTHAEGVGTSALGYISHAEGSGTIANSRAMHAAGMYNKTSANALFVIGNGTANDARSDAFVVTSAGLASAVTLATSGISDVESAIDSLSSNLNSYVKYTDIQYSIGSANTATGSTTSTYSMALGRNNSAYNSYVIGNYNKGNNSYIFGDSCSGTQSYLFGRGLSGKSWIVNLGDIGEIFSPVIVGNNNATKTSAYFVVGAGTAFGNSRADAFIVSSNKIASAADFLAGNGVSLSSLTGLAQVQADWSETVTSNPAYIQNKPDVLTPLSSNAYAKPVNIMVVSAMPASPDPTTIYLVKENVS